VDLGEVDLEPRLVESERLAAAPVIDDSLDDYFDKLDEAFSTVGASDSRLDTRSSNPDRPVLERDLESFDELSFIVELAGEYVESPRDHAADGSTLKAWRRSRQASRPRCRRSTICSRACLCLTHRR
jgi:hypothetical protein